MAFPPISHLLPAGLESERYIQRSRMRRIARRIFPAAHGRE
jgi:hypothetical protein